MKIAIILCTLTSAVALAEDPIPTGFGKDRYEEMLDASPFVLATPPEQKDEGPKDSPFNNVFVTSMSLGRDGLPIVYIKRPGDDQGIKLALNEAHKDSGFTLTEVNWADSLKNAFVTARHANGETKQIKFSEQPAAPALPPGQGGPGQRGPGGGRAVLGMQPAAVPPATGGQGGPIAVPKVGGNVPAPQVPRPTMPQVPRPGGGATLQGGTPGQSTFTQNAGAQRNRVRGPINNGTGGGGNNGNNGGRGSR